MFNLFLEFFKVNSRLDILAAEIAQLQEDFAERELILSLRIGILQAILLQRMNENQKQLIEQLSRLEAVIIPPPPASVRFYTVIGGVLTEISQMQMKVDQVKTITAKPVDKFGNVAQIEAGSGLFSLTDPAAGTLVPAADGLSAEFTPAGPVVPQFNIQFSADADLGAGVATIAGELPVDLLPGDAVAVELSSN